ncbi:hypothetical protein FBULB1_8691 [Fusarium bulbicola]|nr:hypothetical protein FBULB1_8691 [Fusarium bulbicola]
MNFLLLLSLLSFVWAAPMEGLSNLSLDKRDISDSAALHARHDGKTREPRVSKLYNLTTCSVTVIGKGTGGSKAYNQGGTLYLIEGGVNSTGTQNGANIADAYFTTMAPTFIQFASNQMLMKLPRSSGPNVDLATVLFSAANSVYSISTNYANIKQPLVNSPLKFTAEMGTGTCGYKPPTSYTAGPISSLSWSYRRLSPGNPNGQVVGSFTLDNTGLTSSAGFGRYVGTFSGNCFTAYFRFN